MLNIWNDALNLLCFLDTDHKCVFSKLNYGHVQLAHLHSFGIISVVLAFGRANQTVLVYQYGGAKGRSFLYIS